MTEQQKKHYFLKQNINQGKSLVISKENKHEVSNATNDINTF